MERFRGLPPLRALLFPAVGANFVGREHELGRLTEALERGARGVVLIGERGMGKTSLGQEFATRAASRYPDGVFYSSGAIPEQSADSLLVDVLNEPKESLFVLDDADRLRPLELKRLLSLLERSPKTQSLLISKAPLTETLDFEILRLEGLSLRAFHDLVTLRSAPSVPKVDEATIEQLHAIASGNPLFLLRVSDIVHNNDVDSWAELLDRVREFRAPGIIGPTGSRLSSTAPQLSAIVSHVSTTNAQILELLRKTPELAQQLGSRKFEEVVGELLELQGYKVKLTPQSGDGGFDLYAARKEGLGEFLYLVECKRYAPPNKVGVAMVRSLHGVVHAHRATAGAIVTTSFFTAGAKEFQQRNEHQIQLHDYVALQRWLTKTRSSSLGG